MTLAQTSKINQDLLLVVDEERTQKRPRAKYTNNAHARLQRIWRMIETEDNRSWYKIIVQ